MSKNITTLPSQIVMMSVAVSLVIALKADTYIQAAPVRPTNQSRASDPIDVMHSDSYWSPLDECPEARSTDAAGCHPVHLPSLLASLERSPDATPLISKSRVDLEKSSAAAREAPRPYSNIAKSKHDTLQASIANIR
jgi:hypothetical protein